MAYTELIRKYLREYIINKIRKKNDEIEEDKKEDITPVIAIDEDLVIPTEEQMLSVDYSTVPDPEVTSSDRAKGLVVMDDIPYTEILYKSDAKKILKFFNKDLYLDYNVVRCYGDTAGFMLYKHCIIKKNKVDRGILDITLGHNIKLPNGKTLELDGVDLAIMLKRLYPDFKFLLCTAHTLNKKYTIVDKYAKKLKHHLGIDLEDVYLSKNDDRVELIYNLLYKM